MNVIRVKEDSKEYLYSISGTVSSNKSHTIFECNGLKRLKNKNNKEVVRLLFVKNDADPKCLVEYGHLDIICNELPKDYSDDELHKTYAEYDIINSQISLYIIITPPVVLDVSPIPAENRSKKNKKKIDIRKLAPKLARIILFSANIVLLSSIVILLIYNRINSYNQPAIGFRIVYYIIMLVAAIPYLALKIVNLKLKTKKYRIIDKRYILFTSILLLFQSLFLTILLRSDIMLKENISNDTVDDTTVLTSTVSSTVTTIQTTTTVQESLITQEFTSDASESVSRDSTNEMKKKCDLNDDGKVDEADYEEFENKYKEYMQGLLTQEEINALDIDGKGSLTTFDGEEIKKYYD